VLAGSVFMLEVRKVRAKRSGRLMVMVKHSHIFSLRVDDDLAEEIHVRKPNRRRKVAKNVAERLYR
jgi:hypothetical protein